MSLEEHGRHLIGHREVNSWPSRRVRMLGRRVAGKPTGRACLFLQPQADSAGWAVLCQMASPSPFLFLRSVVSASPATPGGQTLGPHSRNLSPYPNGLSCSQPSLCLGTHLSGPGCWESAWPLHSSLTVAPAQPRRLPLILLHRPPRGLLEG